MFEILSFASLFTVIGIILKIIRSQKCPSDEQLRKTILFRNNRDQAETDRIISHLGICEKCRDRVSELND